MKYQWSLGLWQMTRLFLFHEMEVELVVHRRFFHQEEEVELPLHLDHEVVEVEVELVLNQLLEVMEGQSRGCTREVVWV